MDGRQSIQELEETGRRAMCSPPRVETSIERRFTSWYGVLYSLGGREGTREPVLL